MRYTEARELVEAALEQLDEASAPPAGRTRPLVPSPNPLVPPPNYNPYEGGQDLDGNPFYNPPGAKPPVLISPGAIRRPTPNSVTRPGRTPSAVRPKTPGVFNQPDGSVAPLFPVGGRPNSTYNRGLRDRGFRDA